MAELCFSQTCVLSLTPLENVSFMSGVLYMYAHMIYYCSVSRHTLDIHKCWEQTMNLVTTLLKLDCNGNLPYANPLKRRLLEMHKIPP